MRSPRGAILYRNQRQRVPADSGAQQQGARQCEVIAANTATAGSVAPVSPAVSPPISPSTVENNKIETDGNQCGSQSGNGNTKRSCYECEHRRELIGDAHSSCVHPSASPMALLVFSAGQTEFRTLSLHVRGNTHGVRSGWFLWPLNFDPVWLEICSGFQKSEKTA